jgi:hypothetical protein
VVPLLESRGLVSKNRLIQFWLSDIDKYKKVCLAEGKSLKWWHLYWIGMAVALMSGVAFFAMVCWVPGAGQF